MPGADDFRMASALATPQARNLMIKILKVSRKSAGTGPVYLSPRFQGQGHRIILFNPAAKIGINNGAAKIAAAARQPKPPVDTKFIRFSGFQNALKK